MNADRNLSRLEYQLEALTDQVKDRFGGKVPTDAQITKRVKELKIKQKELQDDIDSRSKRIDKLLRSTEEESGVEE